MKIIVSILEKNRKVLVIRRKEKEGALHWQFPAGSTKEGEIEQETAERETFEETGIVCKAIKKIGERTHPNTGKEIAYWFCEYISGQAFVKDKDELDVAEWLSPDETLKVITTDIYDPVKKFILSLKK